LFPKDVLNWENLGLACPKCNNEKSARWSDEEPIVWPYKDEPGEHFSFSGPFLEAKTERGRMTLEHVKLNRRSQLIERRTEMLRQLERSVELLLLVRTAHVEIVQRAILESTAPKREFSAFAIAYLDQQGLRGPNDYSAKNSSGRKPDSPIQRSQQSTNTE
jgi:hypothetical protein